MRTQQWEVGGHEGRAFLRPDGRWLVRLPEDPATWEGTLAARPPEVDRLLVNASDEGAERLADLGFTAGRTEQLWHVPVLRLAATDVGPIGHDLVPVTDCDLQRVTELDNMVRQQIPGTEDWVGTSADLQTTLRDDEFDPQLYLVAVHREQGSYDGLVRVWNRRPRPRLGCLGVKPSWRRTRLAAGLIGAVAATLRERGVTHIETETDLRNWDSHSLAANHGGIPVGRVVEWVRD